MRGNEFRCGGNDDDDNDLDAVVMMWRLQRWVPQI